MDDVSLSFLELTYEEIELLESTISQIQLDFTSLNHCDFFDIMDVNGTEKESTSTDDKKMAMKQSEIKEELKQEKVDSRCCTPRSRSKLYSPQRDVFPSPRKDALERDVKGKGQPKTPRKSQKCSSEVAVTESTSKTDEQLSSLLAWKMPQASSSKIDDDSEQMSLHTVKKEWEEDIQVVDVIQGTNSEAFNTDLQVVYESRKHNGRRSRVRNRTMKVGRVKTRLGEGSKRTLRLMHNRTGRGRWTRSAQRNAQGFMLHHAVANGDIGTVAALVKSGVNVFTPDETGRTSLHLACEMGRLDLMRLLLGVETSAGHASTTPTSQPMDNASPSHAISFCN